MVNDIVNAISNALYENFEGVKIYSEPVKQGFESPSFFVLPLVSLETPLLGVRAKRVMEFDIHYFPVTKSNVEMFTVRDKLFGVLRCVKLLDDTYMNGWDLEGEIVDGVLHFFVKYKPIIRYATEQAEVMETMKNSIEHKG